MGPKKFHPKIQFVRNILSNLNKNIFEQAPKRQFSVSYHKNISHIFQLPLGLYNVVYWQGISPQHCTAGEGMREGEI